MHVMAVRNACAFFNESPRRGEHVLPAPFPLRVRILARQRARQLNAAGAILEILLVKLANAFEMLGQGGLKRPGEHRHSIDLTFSVPYDDLILSEVHILDPEPQAFQQREPAP